MRLLLAAESQPQYYYRPGRFICLSLHFERQSCEGPLLRPANEVELIFEHHGFSARTLTVRISCERSEGFGELFSDAAERITLDG
jgi:hypothetical protein